MSVLDERRREINQLIEIMNDINKRINILEVRTAELHTLLYNQKKDEFLDDKTIRNAFTIQNNDIEDEDKYHI